MNDKKKIGGISGPKGTKAVGKAGEIEEVEATKRAGQVGKVAGVTGSKGAAGAGLITTAQRDQLFSLIEEEAEKIFGKKKASDEHREVIERAVKMAVDASLVDEEADPDSDTGAEKKEDR